MTALPDQRAVRALLDPYDSFVDRDDGGVAFSRVAATLLVRRAWRYDAHVGVAQHREEGGEVAAAWLELPTQEGDARIDYRAGRFYPDDATRIPQGVFALSAPSALTYVGVRTHALGPLDPVAFRWLSGRRLEDDADAAVIDDAALSSTAARRPTLVGVVSLEEWRASATQGAAVTELRLHPDVARALGVDLAVGVSAQDGDEDDRERYVVDIGAPVVRARYQGILDHISLPGDRDRRETLPESLFTAFGLRADEPVWREWRSA